MSIPRWSGNLSARVWLLTAFWATLGAVGDARSFSVQEPAGPEPAPASAPPASAPGVAADRPRPPAAREVIVLDGVSDLGAFWEKLAGPYLIVKKPVAAGGQAGDAKTMEPNRDHVVDAVKLEGAVVGDRAQVAVVIDATALVDGPIWASIRLDGEVVLAAHEGEKELEVRQGPEKQWEARLQGAGKHRIRIDLLTPVRAGGERKSLELAIPFASSTSFALNLPRAVFDADIGPGEAVGQKPAADGKGVVLFARAAPRPRLAISWSEESGADARIAPLLTAQVEIAVDVDSEAVATRSKWVIRCVRGVGRSLQIRLEDDEADPRIQLNDQFVASGIEQSKGGNLLTIPLTDPMRPGDARSLTLETRRPLSTRGGKTMIFSGYPLTNAGEQSGMIAISQSENLWIDLVHAQGLRRIDPRGLPTTLLAQPGTSIALQFLDQPFRLELGVEDAPPLYRAESSATLTIEGDQVRNETTINIQRARGRLFEIEIGVAPELKSVTAGPAELIESTTPPTQERSGLPAPADRILKLRLTALGRDQKSLSLKLVGRQEAPTSGEARLGLFTPRGGVVSTSASFTLRTGRDLTVESLDEALFTDVTRDEAAIDGKTPADALASAAAPSLRLRSTRNPGALKVRLEHHPLELAHETSLSAQVDRLGVDVHQESAVQVRYGAVRSLIVKVPAKTSNRWTVSAREAIARENLGPAKDGGRRFRLAFDRPIVDASTLTFRYRIPLGRSLEPAEPTSFPIPAIQIEDGTAGDCVFDLTPDPNVRLKVSDPSWSRLQDADAGLPGAPSTLRFRSAPGAAPNGLNVAAELVESAPLPRLVVSRALLSSTLGFDGELRVHAWYALDARPSSLSASLPEGARWIRARVDGRVVEQIEPREDGSYRFGLPAESPGRSVVVEFEYQTSAAAADRAWESPKLLEGADVLQTYWLVQAPWNAALIGLPGGWSDENRWYWDVYVWKRRPIASLDELVAWATGTTPDPTAPLEAVADRDLHGYLFGRAGPPATLRVWIAPRAWIIVVCSGLVLALGFAATFVRLSERWVWGGTAVVGLLAAMFLHPSVIALFLQAASCGFVLALSGYLIHRALHRDEPAASSASAGSSPAGGGESFDSSRRSAAGVGSDDSTAVRVRVSSTLDYLSVQATPESGLEPSRSSSLSENPANP